MYNYYSRFELKQKLVGVDMTSEFLSSLGKTVNIVREQKILILTSVYTYI